jgi:deleted in liver cancer protein
VSPRRKRPTGIPDAKELAETRASHDCLTYLILNYRQIFTISSEKISKCNFGCMEESRPRPLESLGEELQSNWCGYLYECTKATMREVKEK